MICTGWIPFLSLFTSAHKAMLCYDVADEAVLKCVLKATDGFLFVAQCENGCIIYVSDSVTPVLSFSQVCMYSMPIILSRKWPLCSLQSVVSSIVIRLLQWNLACSIFKSVTTKACIICRLTVVIFLHYVKNTITPSELCYLSVIMHMNLKRTSLQSCMSYDRL